jgi:hypothetical protein
VSEGSLPDSETITANMPASDYRHMLDAMARFYNSQIIVHVGYLLTTAALYLGSLAVLERVLDDFLGAGPVAVCSLIALGFLLGFALVQVKLPYPPFIPYLLGRTQLYQCLSEVVWDHMGITGADTQHFQRLKERVFRETPTRNPVGLQEAIINAFEARLYVSLCRQEQKVTKDATPKMTHNWRSAFYLEKQDVLACNEAQENYAWHRILKYYDLPTLLMLAHKTRLESFQKAYDDWSREKKKDPGTKDVPNAQKWELFHPFLESMNIL